MAEGTYVVFDLETTGLDPLLDGILEVAAVRLEGGAVTASWQTLVNPGPGMAISAASQAIHGIDAAMVADAPAIAEVLPAFLAFVGDATLVAHHAPFDLGFLNRALAVSGRPPIANAAIDTLEMAREVFPDQRSHKLEALCRLLGHEAATYHRAADDAAHLAAVFPRLLALWEQKRAWYRAQFGQIEHLARRYDQVQRLGEALQLELGELRRVLGLYFEEHPDARVPLPGGEAMVRVTKASWDYDLAALQPHFEAWGLADRFVKLDRQRLERWLAAGRFDEDQKKAIAATRAALPVTHRFVRVNGQAAPSPTDGEA